MPAAELSFLETAWGRISAVAAEAHLTFILGTERIVNNDLLATALVSNGDGSLDGFQDRVQVAIEKEAIYKHAAGRIIFRSDRVTYGVVICHEGWRYPEAVWAAVQRGAQIVFTHTFIVPPPRHFSPARSEIR